VRFFEGAATWVSKGGSNRENSLPFGSARAGRLFETSGIVELTCLAARG